MVHNLLQSGEFIGEMDIGYIYMVDMLVDNYSDR